ncbi:MAG: hypothetical protein KY455_09510 [Euryarchaeota archaeon]|nr:hypothetical protein [Euryarchaeota archaeon]
MRPQDHSRRPFLWDLALLGVALLFVGLVTYLPHMDTHLDDDDERDPWTRLTMAYVDWQRGGRDDHEYPVHVDEPMHWARMAAMQESDSLRHPSPYTGAEHDEGPLSLRGLVHEKGFYVAFAGYQEMSGIGWMDLIRLVPTLWAGLTATLLWAALHPWRGAPLAAAFVALVPTTARFLGIGFFVPIGIGLAWIAAAMVLQRVSGFDRRSLLLLLMAGAWSFFIHLIAGFALVLLVLASLPVLVRAERRNLLLLIVGILLPLVWFYEGFRPDVQGEIDRISFLPIDFTAFDLLGIPFLIAWVLGITWMAYRPPEGAARIPMVAATIAGVVAFAFIVMNQLFDLSSYALYDRWHQPFALFATVPVAYLVVGAVGLIVIGLRRVEAKVHEEYPDMRLGPAVMALAVVAAALIGGAVATPAVAQHLDEPYYHVIEERDWKRFQAARDVGDTHPVFLTHPWKAPVFAAMTGKEPVTWLIPGSPPVNGEDYVAYLRGKNSDGVWLVNKEITIIIDDVAPEHPAYHEVAPGVWVLDPAVAKALRDIREMR